MWGRRGNIEEVPRDFPSMGLPLRESPPKHSTAQRLMLLEVLMMNPPLAGKVHLGEPQHPGEGAGRALPGAAGHSDAACGADGEAGQEHHACSLRTRRRTQSQ